MSKKLPWIKLDGKKDPPANEAVLLWVKANDIEWWAKGILARIEFAGKEKRYVFESVPAEVEYADATHYMTIEKPKE